MRMCESKHSRGICVEAFNISDMGASGADAGRADALRRSSPPSGGIYNRSFGDFWAHFAVVFVVRAAPFTRPLAACGAPSYIRSSFRMQQRQHLSVMPDSTTYYLL